MTDLDSSKTYQDVRRSWRLLHQLALEAQERLSEIERSGDSTKIAIASASANKALDVAQGVGATLACLDVLITLKIPKIREALARKELVVYVCPPSLPHSCVTAAFKECDVKGLTTVYPSTLELHDEIVANFNAFGGFTVIS